MCIDYLKMHSECTILMQFLKKFPGEAPRTPTCGRGWPPTPPSPFRRFAPQWSLRASLVTCAPPAVEVLDPPLRPWDLKSDAIERVPQFRHMFLTIFSTILCSIIVHLPNKHHMKLKFPPAFLNISLLSLSTWTNDVIEGIVYYPNLRGTQRGVVPTIPPTWKKSITFA